jgi:hypothetical protein
MKSNRADSISRDWVDFVLRDSQTQDFLESESINELLDRNRVPSVPSHACQ